jgi:hypothetical protein
LKVPSKLGTSKQTFLKMITSPLVNGTFMSGQNLPAEATAMLHLIFNKIKMWRILNLDVLNY